MTISIFRASAPSASFALPFRPSSSMPSPTFVFSPSCAFNSSMSLRSGKSRVSVIKWVMEERSNRGRRDEEEEADCSSLRQGVAPESTSKSSICERHTAVSVHPQPANLDTRPEKPVPAPAGREPGEDLVTHRRPDLWVECIVYEEVHTVKQRRVCVGEGRRGRGRGGGSCGHRCAGGERASVGSLSESRAVSQHSSSAQTNTAASRDKAKPRGASSRVSPS